MFYRIHDCWNRPIASAPDAYVDVLERTPVRGQRALELTGGRIRALNLGSYNYLGFAAHDPYCTPRALETLKKDGWSSCSSRAEAGTTRLHLDLERELAAFLGKPAALCFGMGFATNSAVLPVLAGPGCLVVSDALNHASIVSGARGSGAKVAVFAHNDVDSLEGVLRSQVARGQPRTRRPWKKVLVVVEGIYSMEGELAPLPDIVAVCKRYRAYLYLDEAHSIGALGRTGRGVCEALGVDPGDVDVMMGTTRGFFFCFNFFFLFFSFFEVGEEPEGKKKKTHSNKKKTNQKPKKTKKTGTFTKSFGGAGGYIAGSQELIDALKRTAPGHLEATAMSPPVAQQVLSALRVLSGADGSSRGAEKLRRLRDNANYLRARLLALGVNVLGDWDSPVMPIMLFQPGKIAALSRECLARGVAMVVVGFPATPLLTARARVCVSAAHSREDLDYAVDVLDEVAGLCLLRYGDRKKEAAAAATAAAAEGQQQRTTSEDENAAASSAAALIS